MDNFTRILETLCRTSGCEKAFLSHKPVAFTPVPPVVIASKLTARAGSLEIQFGICIDRFVVLFR